MLKLIIWGIILTITAYINDIKFNVKIPYYALSVLFIFIGLIITKYFDKKQEQNLKLKAEEYLYTLTNAKIYDLYKNVEPILDNLRKNENEILKRFLNTPKSYVQISSNEKIEINHLLAKGLYLYLDVKDYWNITHYIHVLQIKPLFLEVLKIYFK